MTFATPDNIAIAHNTGAHVRNQAARPPPSPRVVCPCAMHTDASRLVLACTVQRCHLDLDIVFDFNSVVKPVKYS